MYRVISRDGCVHCQRLLRAMEREEVPRVVLKIGEDITREEVLSLLSEAGIETRLLPFVFVPTLSGDDLVTGEHFLERILYTYRRFPAPADMVEYLKRPAQVTFTRKDGTDKTIRCKVEGDDALSDGSLISARDERDGTWNSFRYHRVRDIRRA